MATPPRLGLNCTFSYKRGGTTRAYRLRCSGVQHGTQMISAESQSRVRRAYYPHRVSTQQFAIQVELKGYAEHKDFSNWLSSYASYALNPDLQVDEYPTMSVVVPSREFVHRGVPLSGYLWGDHVGSMVFNPTIVFEAAYEPWDKARPEVTRVENSWFAFKKDDAIKYFYPFGLQLSGEKSPIGDYDQPIYPPDPGAPSDGGGGGVPDNGDISPTK